MSTAWGNITYANGASTPLSDFTVTLTPGGAFNVTDASGNYNISSIDNGVYSIGNTTSKAWGGFTTADNLLVKRYLLSLLSLNDLKKRSADVNASNTISSADQLTIGRRLLSLLTSWPAPDFVFDGMFGVPPLMVDIRLMYLVVMLYRILKACALVM